MADKDFKVKNKLFVNGLSQASGVVLSTNNNLDSHTNLPTQYGGTGTTTSPNAGQILYSTAGSTYTPTDLSSLTISNSGGSTITAASAATKGLVIKGAASQTANLIEWQNTDNSVLSSVGPLGAVSINTQNANALGVSALGALEVKRTAFFDAGTSATVAVVVRGRPSQTANLQEWQNSNGGVDTAVTSTGRLSVRTTLADAGLNVGAPSAATVNLIVRGAASQTANLQEWQNSAGTVLARINAGGVIKSSILAGLTDGYSLIQFNYDTNGVGITTGAAAQKGLIIRGSASQTADLQQWQDSAGAVLASIDPNGQLRTPQILNIASFNNSRLQMTNTGSLFDVGVASNVALRVRGAASQTADLQQWQDSAGAVLTKITSGGTLRVPIITDAAATGSLIYMNTTNINIDTRTATNIGLIINGVASQTASLQEWRNSAGTVLANIFADGDIGINSIRSVNGSVKRILMNQTTESVRVIAATASYIGLVVKGVASQTANLQEWQNSGGTTLAYVKDNGYSASIAGFTYIYTTTIQGWNGVGGSISFANASPIIIAPQSASTVALAIKGAASQTADLQQWQNSAGTVLAEINANGGLELNGKDVELMNYMGAF